MRFIEKIECFLEWNFYVKIIIRNLEDCSSRFRIPSERNSRASSEEKITSKTHYPRCEKNQSRDKNPRGLFRGFDPEEFSSRFIFYTSRKGLPRVRKLNLEVQKYMGKVVFKY